MEEENTEAQWAHALNSSYFICTAERSEISIPSIRPIHPLVSSSVQFVIFVTFAKPFYGDLKQTKTDPGGKQVDDMDEIE